MKNKKEYLNEENYQRTNAKVKKTGKILIIIGLVMLSIGVISIFVGILGVGNQISNVISTGEEAINVGKGLSSAGSFLIGTLMFGPGIFVTLVGCMVRFLMGNRREITAYTTQQVMPVAKEGIEEMAPTIGGAAKEVAKGIKEGINEADNK